MSASDCEEEQEIFFTLPSIEELAASIDDELTPIAKRMRSCFLLKQLHTPEAIDVLARGLHSPSTLLGHECAYVLGQMCDPLALPYLTACLKDGAQHPIVRHECAEALANIDADESLPLLQQLCHDTEPEVAETCCIAVDKMTEARRRRKEAQPQQQQQQRQDEGGEQVEGEAPASKYASVDPAPPLPSHSVPALLASLSDSRLSMYERYRAMFALRNLGTGEAIAALTASLASSNSPVFRHEVAYVLGQIAHPAALPALRALLADKSEHAMVRHEAAEAIGSIAEEDSEAVLGPYASDAAEDVIVKESVLVALDLAEYWNSDEVSTAVDDSEQQGQEERTNSSAEGYQKRNHLTADIAVTRA